jgi:hypothetical protein
MPMSITRRRPAQERPGSIHRPGLAAWKVAVALATTARPGVSPLEASTPLGTSAASTATPLLRIASIAAATAPRGSPLAPVPSRASITSVASAAIPAAADSATGGRLAEALEHHARVAGELAGPAGQQHVDLAAVAAQQARCDQAVAAVVALAGDDDDPPLGSHRRRAGREPGAGLLHQLERGHAALDRDRPAPRRSRASSASGCVRPERLDSQSERGSSQHRHRGRHPARVGQRHLDLDAELLGASARGAVQRERDRRAAAEHLDVVRREDRRPSALDTASLAQKRAARCCAARARDPA